MNVAEDFEREARFAVVIYGGVSLAVYINGVAQEMLRLVRATAAPTEELMRSEKVYRKLACIAGLADPQAGGEGVAIHGKVGPDGLAEASDGKLRTKFVIDILSGTSAGGINAIYLAKALARNESLRQLALMWINVADIAKLLNDKASAEGPVREQAPPKSLLNSRWMYLKLIQALDGMDASPAGRQSLVDDLDLFTTATDLDGVALPIALADKQVFEFRHRNVFHFQKRGDGTGAPDDFGQDMNPFLAFAARCTSAFPFAFEPMALCDAYEVFPRLEAHRGQPYCNESADYWQRFYLDYIRDADPNTTTKFLYRPFGDGGYLDNKPFSYAIDVVTQRHADMPVDRKLIYVEPSPEAIGKVERKRAGEADRPNAIENSLAALIDLPRYETIRQDLERVLEWNRNVGRLQRVVRDATEGLEKVDVAAHKAGPAYRFYLRLRLSAVTDRVASRVAEALKLDPKSARGDAIRGLAGSWRVANVATEAEKLGFLAAYDFEYLERAIAFLRKRLRSGAARESREQSRQLAAAKRRLHRLAERPLPDLRQDPQHPLSPEQLQQQEDERKQDLEFAVNPQFAAAMRESDPSIPAEALADTEAGLEKRLRWLLAAGWEQAIQEADRALRNHFAELGDIRRELTPLMEAAGGWDRFDVHDSVVFPLVFGTCLGEFDPIDIVRISPADVADLNGVDDQRDGGGPKLKGEKFGAFGGFLDRNWRLHDMLRGRLHAAERLITAVLSSAEPETARIREALIREAQSEIALEWQETLASLLEEETTEHVTSPDFTDRVRGRG